MSGIMSAFSEQWREYRDQGLENFLWKGQVYTTRRKGESVEDWKKTLDKKTAAAGRSGRGAGSPLPGSRGHQTVLSGAQPPPRKDGEQAVNRALNTARASVEQLYVNGEISKAGYDRMISQFDAYDDLRYGRPADDPDTDDEDDGITAEPHNPLDENIIVEGDEIERIAGKMDSVEAEAVAGIMSAYGRGAITEGQAALAIKRMERA